VLKLSSEHLEAEPEKEPEEEPADGASTEPLDLRSLELKLTVDLEALADATGRKLGRNDINMLKVFLSSSLSSCFLIRLAVAILSKKAITSMSEPLVSSWKRLHWRKFVNVLQMGSGFIVLLFSVDALRNDLLKESSLRRQSVCCFTMPISRFWNSTGFPVCCAHLKRPLTQLAEN
jgi:hypothetical protein